MVESLFHSHWHRVADLQPKLGPHVQVQRQRYRGETWYVLRDTASGSHYRMNSPAYQFVGRLDGARSVNQVWELAARHLGDAALTQGDIIRLLAQLTESGLVHAGTKPDVESLFRVEGERTRRRRREQINPLAFRVPLFDPTRLLDRLEPGLRTLLHPGVFAVWVLVAFAGALMVAVNWQALAAHAGANLQSARYLLLAWLCYPVMKALHELAHAAAVRRCGGAVHEAGITLLFFTPTPYVDASAASAFRARYQRALVSAAGIMVELLIGIVALAVWLAVQPGLVRDLAFVTVALAAVSTVLVNGNPLLRFDGYYVLSDALDVPNLAARSTAYWVYLLQRYLLGASSWVAPPVARGEGKWLFSYAPLSFAYRLTLACAVVFWIGSKSWLLGVLAALLISIMVLVKPAAAFLKAALSAGGRGRALVAAAVVAAAIFVVPLPFSVLGQGVVWPPDDAQLRTDVDGFVSEVLATTGDDVQAGQVLIQLSDPALIAERAALVSRMSGLRAEQYDSLLRNPVRALDVLQRIEGTTAELERAEQRLDALNIRSKVTGRLVLARPEDLPGSFVRKGAMVGYVLTPGSLNVRALLGGEDAPLVRERARIAQVWLAERPEQPLKGQISRDTPAATQALPNAALGDRAGGAYRTDPADGMRALEPLFQVDVAVAGQRLERVGGRAWIRFDLGNEALALQGYRRLSQLLLSHFNPAGD